ncbi:hypothetical protein AC630_25850 [Bradyrhizobium sp. AS23.2]|nr:hypothetical protein AC630_25850 [Bradyrhizobium sp. AS23.2]
MLDGGPTRGRDRGLDARKNRLAQSAKPRKAGIIAGDAENTVAEHLPAPTIITILAVQAPAGQGANARAA